MLHTFTHSAMMNVNFFFLIYYLPTDNKHVHYVLKLYAGKLNHNSETPKSLV